MLNERIRLRKLKATDLDAFMTWAGDPTVTHSLFWDAYQDKTSAQQFLSGFVEKHPWFMAICLDEQPVGAITLDRGSARSAKRAELGYVLAKSQWGKGIATEAVRQALTRGFSDLDIVRIDAFVDPLNEASVRVLEKGGLEREGRLKKYVIHRGQLCDRYIYSKTLNQ